MRLLSLILGVALLPTAVLANGINVSQATLVNRDTTLAASWVQFSMDWQNSWRYDVLAGINNWDAAWVFVKFRVGGSDYRSTPGATSSGTVLTVNSTSGLRVGMPVWVGSGSGQLSPESRVTAILSRTTFEISHAPITPLSNQAVVQASRIWEHAWLGDEGDHVAGTGTALTMYNGLANPAAAFDSLLNPALGVFFYRTNVGYGDVNTSDIALRWNYGLNQIAHDAVVEIRVYAVEMVYVPQGAFFAGDGQASPINGQFRQGNTQNAFRIQTESALTLGGSDEANLNNHNASGMLTADDFDDAVTQTLPDSFPKGFAAFYTMKYELSQRQYLDFLNSLDRLQQNNRTATDLSPGTTSVSNRYVMSASSSVNARNGIKVAASISAFAPLQFYADLNGNDVPNENNDGQDIAANWLSWGDLAAYLDWSALRPLSELEYEKIARGQRYPKTNSYAWASTQLVAAAAISNPGTDGEVSSTPAANAVMGDQAAVQGPLRVGSFAVDSAGRAEAGAAFYGVMELSGNVNEQLVSLGNSNGRLFGGAHGNGQLISSQAPADSLGFADVNGWPAATAAGRGLRGGDWSSDSARLRLTDRQQAVATAAGREAVWGGRGGRSVVCSAPTATVAVSGDPIPFGDVRSYTASGATAYWWVVSDNLEIKSGQGSDTAEIFAIGPGELRIAAFNSCGCGPETTITISLQE
jgi:formylglycine-generating enzyme required for sulfatase activity